MDRRAALRALGTAAAAAPFAARDLSALGRAVHARLGVWQGARSLDAHQDATVVVLTDLLLPATDTPGARAARVNEFIDLLLTEWYEPAARDAFLAGLADVDRRAHARTGKAFVDAAPADQVAVLLALDAEAAQWSDAPEATRGAEPFFHRLKWLTLYGYYTSEVGAVEEQHFVMIPGRYVPCAPADTLSGPR